MATQDPKTDPHQPRASRVEDPKPTKRARTDDARTDDDGPSFFVLIMHPDREEIREVREPEILEMASSQPEDVKTELFDTEKDARDKMGTIARGRVHRANQKAKARAKVERDRRLFAERNPDKARTLARQEAHARERAAELAKAAPAPALPKLGLKEKDDL